MSSSVPYGELQTPNGALTSEGGPWSVVRSTEELYCWTANTSFCLDYKRCIACTVLLASPTTTYNIKYFVNISIPLTQYGDVDMVGYLFSYNLNWASDKTAPGQVLTVHSNFGTSSHIDNFVSNDRYWLWYSNPSSLGERFAHSGMTSLSKSMDGQTGYIPVVIDFSFKREPGADVIFYMKGATFQITAPAVANSSPEAAIATSSSLSNTASSVPITTSSSTELVVPLPGISHFTVMTEGVSVGNISSLTPELPASPQMSSSMIIGIVISIISALGASVAILLLLYRRKLKQLNSNRDMGMHNKGSSSRPTIRSESLLACPPPVFPEHRKHQPTEWTSTPFRISLPPEDSSYGYMSSISSDLEGSERGGRRHRTSDSSTVVRTGFAGTGVLSPSY
ncbi:hypothetical protein FRC17_009198 [Serendipita sp. 399]|nr:hypothetical protein FRC17_009198 [Serendipita sp. 399]